MYEQTVKLKLYSELSTNLGENLIQVKIQI